MWLPQLRAVGCRREFLHAPVGNFSGVNFIVGPAIEFMDGHEFLQLLAALAEFSDDAAVKLHLVNFAAVSMSVVPVEFEL